MICDLFIGLPFVEVTFLNVGRKGPFPWIYEISPLGWNLFIEGSSWKDNILNFKSKLLLVSCHNYYEVINNPHKYERLTSYYAECKDGKEISLYEPILHGDCKRSENLRHQAKIRLRAGYCRRFSYTLQTYRNTGFTLGRFCTQKYLHRRLHGTLLYFFTK
jgi:hypothetical protein